jgi:hypothetical protein
MEKVMISKEEAEALESALEVNGGDKSSVVHWHAQNLFDGKRKPLNDLDLDTLCRALYVGYELEPSPEEQVLKIYKFYRDNGFAREVIEEVLAALNVEIKGIIAD